MQIITTFVVNAVLIIAAWYLATIESQGEVGLVTEALWQVGYI